MSEQPKRKGCLTRPEVIVLSFLLCALLSIAVPVYRSIIQQGHTAKAASNIKSITLACRVFANDWDGALPQSGIDVGFGEAKLGTSGDAWALLWDAGALQSSLIYFQPGARNCGAEPTYAPPTEGDKAPAIPDTDNYLSYWAGLMSSDPGALPIVWQQANAPLAPRPKWTREKGHPHKREVVIGFNDGSAIALSRSPEGTLLGELGKAINAILAGESDVAAYPPIDEIHGPLDP